MCSAARLLPALFTFSTAICARWYPRPHRHGRPDFGAALQRMEALGARLFRGPMHIEDDQRMGQVKDPWNNLIGLRGPG